MTKTTRPSAAELAAQIETARGLVLALETLTAAGDYSRAGVHNAAARRPQADAVLQALADQLCRMQDAADQLDEAEARRSPAGDQTGAPLCEQDADTVTLKLSRNTCNRLSTACLSLADEVRAQIDDHDRRHAEPAQGGAAR